MCARVCVGAEAAGWDESVLWRHGEAGGQPQHAVYQAAGENGLSCCSWTLRSTSRDALENQNKHWTHLHFFLSDLVWDFNILFRISFWCISHLYLRHWLLQSSLCSQLGIKLSLRIFHSSCWDIQEHNLFTFLGQIVPFVLGIWTNSLPFLKALISKLLLSDSGHLSLE